MATYQQLVQRGLTPQAAKATIREMGAKGRAHVLKRRPADSDALYASAEARRIVKPVLVTGVTLAADVTVIQPVDFGRLQIASDAYQRERVDNEVNRLIAVIKMGGAVPDPVHVAERADGSWWIVEGQQRFHAHEALKMPLRALIHKVHEPTAEERLFVVLNSKRKVAPRTIIKGWPGPAGVFMRRMDQHETSPVRAMIDFGTNHKRALDALPLMRAVLAVTTGTVAAGDTATQLLPRLDAALQAPGRMAWAESFVQLVAAVFGANAGKGGGKVRALPLIALANVAHRKYLAAGRPTFPRTCGRLRAVNWDTAVPTHSRQYLPALENRIERLWR